MYRCIFSAPTNTSNRVALILYAAYGSNLHPVRLQRRVPSATLVGTAAIDGWQLQFHKRSTGDGSAKCNIVDEPGNRIYVAMYDLDPREKPVLDRIEGLEFGYREKIMTVSGFGDCFTYIATTGYIDESLSPYCWYHRLVLRGCEHHGFPDWYVEQIRSVPHIADPDDERRAANERILQAM